MPRASTSGNEWFLQKSALPSFSHVTFCLWNLLPPFPLVFYTFPSLVTVHLMLKSPMPFTKAAVGQSVSRCITDGSRRAHEVGICVPSDRWGWYSQGLLQSPPAHSPSPGPLSSEPTELLQILLVSHLPLNRQWQNWKLTKQVRKAIARHHVVWQCLRKLPIIFQVFLILECRKAAC